MTLVHLAVSARMTGAIPPGAAVIDGGNSLPPLGDLKICLYDAGLQKGEVVDALRAHLRCAYGD